MDELTLVASIRADVKSEEAQTSQAHRLLMAAIEAEAVGRTLPLRRPTRRVWRGRGAGLIAAAAAGLLAVIVVSTTGLPPQLSRHAAAVEALSAAGDAAASRPVLTGEGPYVYTKSLSTSLVTTYDFSASQDPYFVIVRRTREIWKAPDGSGVIITAGEPPAFLSERDRRRWVEAGQPEFGPGVSRESFGPGELSSNNLEGLPMDVDALYGLLSKRASRAATTHDWALLTSVGELLRETAAPAELRRALYQVAARIPSIRLVGGSTDVLGRNGTAVAVESTESGARKRLELLFKEQTGQLLAVREVLLSRDVQMDNVPPTSIAETTFVAAGRTDSVPE